MVRISLEDDADNIRERHYLSYNGPIELGSLFAPINSISYKYKYEVTFEFKKPVDREASFSRKIFHETRNLRICLADGNKMCDFYIEPDYIIILFPESIPQSAIRTLIFEWERVREVEIYWWRIFPIFFFEIYQHEHEFYRCPIDTEIYVAHPSVSWIYRKVKKIFEPGLEWEESPKSDKIVTARPYKTDEEIVWRSKLPKLGKDEKLTLQINYGPNESVRNWITLGAVFALLALCSINFFIFAIPDNSGDPSKRYETVGTIGAAGFATLLAIRTWFYADEIRISGLSWMRRLYTYLALALILNVAAYIASNTVISLFNILVKLFLSLFK